ncbi:CHAT domain-containing protein [Pyxidicoccus fallax]|uniref:CHAT domain-containing protein n=1 Tax=Pyxidicoccus fallax TaxID=394095 RepID=A0A848LMT7_9BACT|nr:CHAT domain-containing tetratricopeptide repeat protein [Pyxidicoccus fallax]NMO19167.1 CHAT domain-containing protein [Pyxidicoccus fallax]NPC84740.1 CHAT domain-containing protein [Pyxidicoccus fallax]
MRLLLAWMALWVMGCAARGPAGASPLDARLQVARMAYEEALRLHEAGSYARAVEQGHRALALREEVLGDSHPEVASCLNLLGGMHRLQGDFARAEPLYDRAVAILEAALGQGQGTAARAIDDGSLFSSSPDVYLQQPRPRAGGRILPDVPQDGGPPVLAREIHESARLAGFLRLFVRAEPLHVRALAMADATLGKSHPTIAALLNELGLFYAAQGLYLRAEPLLQRALAVREAAFGKSHPAVAVSLNSLGILYAIQGLYARAEPLLQRALAMREAGLGGSHPDVAASLNNLATLYANQGLYDRAEPLHERAVLLAEAALGKRHPTVAISLSSLANLYMQQGLYDRAEPLYERALAIRQVAFGQDHPSVAASYTSLANVYRERKDYVPAEALYEFALNVREAALGKSHPDVAASLNNLAVLYANQGLHARAEALYEQALSIREEALGKNHPEVAVLLNNLALLRLAQHRLGEAIPLLTRAFSISERRLRQEALDFSETRLASFLQLLRADEERLYALLRAHPRDARVGRLALGAVLLMKGRSVEQTAGISRAVYRSLGPGERDTFERLRGLRTQLASLSLQGPGPLSLKAYQQRLEALAAQGDALESSLAQRSAPLRALAGLPSLADIVEQVAQALPGNAALVELITYQDRPLLSGPGTSEPHLRYLALVLFPDGGIRVQDLGPAGPIDSAASRMRDALANQEAGVEVHARALYQLAFQPLLPLLGETRRLFVSPDGQLALVPFAALHDGRQFLVEDFDFTYLSSGKDLLPRPQQPVPASSVVALTDPDVHDPFQPADSSLAAAHQAVATRSASLGQVLSNWRGERAQRNRDVIRPSVVVLADPDFHVPLQPAASSAVAEQAVATRSASVGQLLSRWRGALAQRNWDVIRLPGTRQEARTIQHLLPQAQLFLGAEATKERLLNLPAPGILHVATHGFFLEDAPQPAASRGVVSFGGLSDARLSAGPPDPLLRSGLVLAGAATGSSPDSALVTALELASLDLWGTQLVVLSACDTGRGDVKLGQGVYGLRRAFLVAGAETVVMSLWKVNDETTRELMEAYYRHLLEGQGRASALIEAMRELRNTQAHPHYWAPFIAMGRETPLRLQASTARRAPP